MENRISKNKIVLPVTYPIITTYPAYANYLAILSNYKKTESWIYNNFINMWAHRISNKETNFRLSSWQFMETCPYINFSRVERDTIYKKYENIIDFIESALSLGYYLYVFYDEYYIPHCRNYRKRHLSHDLFIFGCNKDTRQFNVADFFYDRKYSFEMASYENVKAAIDKNVKNKYNSHILLLKYKNANYKYDIDILVKNITDYMNSTCSVLNYESILMSPEESMAIKKGDITFGMACYDNIINKLNMIIKNNSKIKDITPLHILYDHKVIMNKRLEYLVKIGAINQNEKLLNIFKEIEIYSLSTRNLFIKYLHTLNKNLIHRIIQNINLMKDYEIKGLCDLLNEIKKT